MGFSFITPTTLVNRIITVTDAFNNPTTPTTLGTLTATDSKPFASGTYTYSHQITVPATNCLNYSNTAKIVETSQADSKTVEVCGPAKTGALTMGYWQNKNGQGIINAANPAALGNYLRGYHPFSDAPSTGLATYVANIIKAANASGAAMNAMLKGQDLATSLDVYFGQGPGLGSVTIDLTKICKMIDGSGGTGTCSGSYENTSSAFGGATSMTVSNMLLYQNIADPLADKGAFWYGQVKAIQGLAKDTFDAINNQVAFAP